MEPESVRDMELLGEALRRLFVWVTEPTKQFQYGRETKRLDMRRVIGRAVAVIYLTSPELQARPQADIAKRIGIGKSAFNSMVIIARDRFKIQTRNSHSQDRRNARKK